MVDAAVITGGTRGLGRALSLEFGRAGYRVTAVYRSDARAAEELAREFEMQGMTGECVCCDVARATPGNVIADGARLVLVNNAWPQYEPKPLHLASWADYELGFSEGVRGSVAMTRALLPRMVAARSGTIVNVLTVGLVRAAPKGFGPYLAAKHALFGFGSAVAAEYGARGVRVFGVCPPFMDTPRTMEWNDRVRNANREASGGATDPRQVASAILALVRNASTPGQGELHSVP